MVTILGVACLDYLPYAFFCYLYPIAVIILSVLLGKKLGWSKGVSSKEPVAQTASEPVAADPLA